MIKNGLIFQKQKDLQKFFKISNFLLFLLLKGIYGKIRPKLERIPNVSISPLFMVAQKCFTSR